MFWGRGSGWPSFVCWWWWCLVLGARERRAIPRLLSTAPPPLTAPRPLSFFVPQKPSKDGASCPSSMITCDGLAKQASAAVHSGERRGRQREWGAATLSSPRLALSLSLSARPGPRSRQYLRVWSIRPPRDRRRASARPWFSDQRGRQQQQRESSRASLGWGWAAASAAAPAPCAPHTADPARTWRALGRDTAWSPLETDGRAQRAGVEGGGRPPSALSGFLALAAAAGGSSSRAPLSTPSSLSAPARQPPTHPPLPNHTTPNNNNKQTTKNPKNSPSAPRRSASSASTARATARRCASSSRRWRCRSTRATSAASAASLR